MYSFASVTNTYVAKIVIMINKSITLVKLWCLGYIIIWICSVVETSLMMLLISMKLIRKSQNKPVCILIPNFLSAYSQRKFH